MAKYYSDAQRRAAKKYHCTHLYRFTVSIPKRMREQVESYCIANGGSVNAAMNRMLREAIGISEADWKSP